jgi:Bacterial proteasome activator
MVIVFDAARAEVAYCVDAPDRVLRMYGLLAAARDELDLTTLPPEGRARVQRLLEVVSAELERSVSPALADELHNLVRRGEARPGAAELRIEYAGILGWASGLVVAMLEQLAAALENQANRAPDEVAMANRAPEEVAMLEQLALPWKIRQTEHLMSQP